jgi:hypothetical protein
VYYTRYFYKKYYAAYAARAGLRLPRWLAVAAFAGFAVYREYLRPALYGVAIRIVRLRRNRGVLAATRAL